MAEKVKMLSVSQSNIKVSNRAFDYLRHQKGKLQPLDGERKKWEAAYNAAIYADYLQLRPYLPPITQAECFLDVGSGLGGIGILINRHYDGDMTPILLDGMKDRPMMELHRKTYSNFDVAQAFYEDNGIHIIHGADANMSDRPPVSEKVPLVISLGSWCFHYPPGVYLDYVRASIKDDGTLITDMRQERDDYADALATAFDKVATINETPKFARNVYTPKVRA